MIKYIKGILSKYITPKTYKNKRTNCDNNIFCLDMEVTSSWLTDTGEVIGFNPYLFPTFKETFNFYNKVCTPLSLVYIWQFGVNDKVFYGRKLEDLKKCIEEMQSLVNGIPTIWIHNAGYEYQFLLNIHKIKEVFARQAHKPIYWVSEYLGCDVKFRCSYFLTRLSLANWAKLTKGKIKKLEGDLDYLKMRTPYTVLTDKEMAYCENDILCMYWGLQYYMDMYKYVEKIPLTQTGEVRVTIKDVYKDDYKYHQDMTNLLPRNETEYNMLKAAFQGGYTHANYLNADMILRNVHSRDISSSYPYAMVIEKYPMEKWRAINPMNIDKYWNVERDYSLIIDVTFYGIESINYNTYISSSKCYYKENYALDNGRVLYAKRLSMIITQLDYEIILKTYSIKKTKLNKVIVSRNAYLDKKMVETVLSFYNNKTVYKDVDGMESIYMASKQKNNSIYGMEVTDIVPKGVTYGSDNMWHAEPHTFDEIVAELRQKPYKNFNAYQHGVFVATYARYNVWQPIIEINKDIVYVDTDSTKYLHDYEWWFENYNNGVMERIRKSLRERGIDENLAFPKNPKGEIVPLGIFSKEPTYKQFITLGAKRYAYTYENDLKEDGTPNIHITVSGVKKSAASQLKSLKDFNEKLVFDTEHTGKLLFKYSTNQPKVTFCKGRYDEFTSDYKFGINAMPTTYSMSMLEEYKHLIRMHLYSFKG